MKNLLIITGPQGSGNHLWSKVFAASSSVFGWAALNDTYWIPHDQEPFAESWHNTELLKYVNTGEYSVTSISCPYAYHGVVTEPNYKEFINAAKDLGYNVKVAIIGRDKTVLQYQQERVRGASSLHRFEHHLDYLCSLDPVFLSTELLYLYGMNYIRSLKSQLGLSIDVSESKLAEILKQDPNSKYFRAAEDQPLDNYVRTVSGLPDKA
jgi:hypothetical protein